MAYGNEMKGLPLVSILIPAFNRPEYFEPALRSALEQIYENIEIIICDDSTNDDVQNIVKRYSPFNSNIIYCRNNPPLGGFGLHNCQKCLELSSGEYINYLFDDDLFHIEKIKKMLPHLMNDENLSLVTSHRKIIDEKGQSMPSLPSSMQLFDKPTTIEGKTLIRFMLKNMLNVVGEPTTVLFKKRNIQKKFGCFNGKQYRCLTDLAMWMELLSTGNGLYLPDTLSYFRVHSRQNSKNNELMLLGTLESYSLIKDAYELGIIESKEEYRDCLLNFLNGNLKKFMKHKPKAAVSEEIYKCFEDTLRELLA